MGKHAQISFKHSPLAFTGKAGSALNGGQFTPHLDCALSTISWSMVSDRQTYAWNRHLDNYMPWNVKQSGGMQIWPPIIACSVEYTTINCIMGSYQQSPRHISANQLSFLTWIFAAKEAYHGTTCSTTRPCTSVKWVDIKNFTWFSPICVQHYPIRSAPYASINCPHRH